MSDINTLRTLLTAAGINYAEDRELDNLEVHVKAVQPEGAWVIFNFTELGRLTDICVSSTVPLDSDDTLLDDGLCCDKCGKLITDHKNDLYHTSGRINGVVDGHIHFCAACAIKVNMPIMDLTNVLPRIEAAPAAPKPKPATAETFDDEANASDPYEGLVGYKSVVWITQSTDASSDEEAHF